MVEVKYFFDKDTSTLTYVVYDPTTRDAVIIDPVLDFDPIAWKIGHHSAQKLIDYCKQHELTVHYLLETHVHADHLTSSKHLQKTFFPQAKIAVGREIGAVQKHFSGLFNIEIPTDGRQFDVLFSDAQVLKAGALQITCLSTPGHTPACYSLYIAEHLFTGDCLFAPDLGTGRCDFPGGDAEALFHSVKEKIYQLPDNTILHSGHDYPSGRELCTAVTLADMKKQNVKLNAQTGEADFIRDRQTRDATLSLPRLIFPSLYVNIRAGHLPEPEANGQRYFKMPCL
jgi:glyoxylase-like metal-dependent hydrolase (beta-lactamase superfamily II)